MPDPDPRDHQIDLLVQMVARLSGHPETFVRLAFGVNEPPP